MENEFINLLAEDTYQWLLSYMERNELTLLESAADILNIIAGGNEVNIN